MKIIYFGFNSFIDHKRGVENVIDFQSKAYEFDRFLYIHWGNNTRAYKYNKFICISIKNNIFWPLVLNLILLRLKIKNKYIIIHSHNPLFSFFSVFNTDILTVHDGLYYLVKSKKHRFYKIFWFFEFFLYNRCSIVHFISNFTKENSLFGKRKNFIIIPNTSHFEFFDHNSPLRVNNNNFILVVRSIEERARFDLLLNVADKLRIDEFRFIVAGKGPLLTYYRNEIERRNLLNIEMLGYVDDKDLINLYKNCKLVLIIAEYGEGFGLPIIEGYLFNKPVIASNRCAIPEVIISPVFLFENNTDDIIRTIKFALGCYDFNFREFYNEKYSNSIILSKFRELYIKLIS